MKIKFLFLILFFLITAPGFAQKNWDWGWQATENPIDFDPFQKAVKGIQAKNTFYGKLIWWYKEKISPRQQRRCPYYPTCSTYTLYSMQKYGFFWGLLMGMDRLYIRENTAVFHRTHYHSIHKNGKEYAYDPPEANYIFGEKDWRLVDPNFLHFFYKP